MLEIIRTHTNLNLYTQNSKSHAFVHISIMYTHINKNVSINKFKVFHIKKYLVHVKIL